MVFELLFAKYDIRAYNYTFVCEIFKLIFMVMACRSSFFNCASHKNLKATDKMTIEKVDLHVHSSASDGTCAPADLPALARQAGLRAVALTDHDTVSGIAPFLEAGRKEGIEVIPGVEISTLFLGREVHIVGLFINPDCPSLLNFLTDLRTQRNQRNQQMVNKLQLLGYDISLEELQAQAGGESVGRPHAAAILIAKGYFSHNQEVFDRCLKRGAPAYCPRQLCSPTDAIAIIHQAGGIAIWAHPLYSNKYARSHIRSVIRKLKPAGLEAIEVSYPGFTPAQTQMLTELAAEQELAVSGGSDFHGDNIPAVKLGSGYGGLCVPYSVLANLKELHAKISTRQAFEIQTIRDNDEKMTEE